MWGFGEITNKNNQIARVDYAIAGESVATGSALNATRGDAILELGDLGAIIFTDAGAQSGGPYPLAVDIIAGEGTYRWWHADGATLDAVLSPDGSFLLTGEGQTIAGNVESPGEIGARSAR